MFTPRPYQAEAIASCTLHFQRRCTLHGICILPTGAGKSVVIANVIKEVGGKFLVLQPSKEILTQNIAKFRAIGGQASIYSAIIGEKIVSDVVFATIGSVINNWQLFKEHNQIIIDECHLVNPAEGMYRFLLELTNDLCCVGLTATPYRLRQSGSASILDFLTTTVPAFFKQVIHVTQQQVLRDSGFLSKITYKRRHEINLNNVKVIRGEYEESSLKSEMLNVAIEDLIIHEVGLLEQSRKAILVFVQFIEILERIVAKRPDLVYITGNTSADARDSILLDFSEGKIKTLLNIGVLTTGFDYPLLDTVIVAKATRSLSLWYQIVGRGQRIAQGKTECLCVDMCDNISVLGDPQDLVIKNDGRKWVAHNKKISTNKMY